MTSELNELCRECGEMIYACRCVRFEDSDLFIPVGTKPTGTATITGVSKTAGCWPTDEEMLAEARALSRRVRLRRWLWCGFRVVVCCGFGAAFAVAPWWGWVMALIAVFAVYWWGP